MGNYSKLPKYVIKVNLFESPLLLSVSQPLPTQPLPFFGVHGGGWEPWMPLKLWAPGSNPNYLDLPRGGQQQRACQWARPRLASPGQSRGRPRLRLRSDPRTHLC